MNAEFGDFGHLETQWIVDAQAAAEKDFVLDESGAVLSRGEADLLTLLCAHLAETTGHSATLKRLADILEAKLVMASSGLNLSAQENLMSGVMSNVMGANYGQQNITITIDLEDLPILAWVYEIDAAERFKEASQSDEAIQAWIDEEPDEEKDVQALRAESMTRGLEAALKANAIRRILPPSPKL